MVLDFGQSRMVESCLVDVYYRKRLGDYGIYLHPLFLFVGHTADQTRGMFETDTPFPVSLFLTDL